MMMNLLAWNIRGLSNSPSVRRLRKIIGTGNISVVAIFEPKITVGDIRDYEFKLNCVGSCANLEGNIWLFWKSGVICSILHSIAQYISALINIGGIEVVIFFLHANCDSNIR